MAKFTFDDFMKAKKEGRVRWDTDALNRDLEQTRGLLDSVSRQQTGGAKLWGYDDIKKNRKTVNDLSGRSAYLRAYINSTKGSKEYDELNEAYDQMSRGLRSAGQYLDARRSYVKPNSGTLAGDIEETMHPTLLGIDPAGYKKQAQARAADEWSKALYMSNKYGSSIKTLGDADKAKESAEDDEERKWLDGYKLSLAENMSDDEARKAYIGEKSDKNKAILKNRIVRGEEKSRQKQYEGLSFGELMAEAQKPEKSSEESKWLKNRAYEIAADWDLAAYNEELRREYNKLDSPEYRVKHSEPGGYDAAEKRKAEILNEMEAVKQQRTVNQRNSSIEGYEKVKEKPDFEEKSAYRKVGGVYGGSDEARPDEGTGTYNYINTEKARTGEISRESIDYLDDEQRKVFNYLYNTEGADAAEDYIEALTPELNRRMTEANTSRAYNEGETNPAVASAVSVGTNLMSGFGIIEDIINSIGGRPIDVNSPAHLSANETTAYRGGVTSGIDKSMKGAGAPKWLQGVPSWGYQAGMSAIDSAVTMAAATLVTAGVGELAAVGDIALSADTLNTITSTTSSVIMGSQVATQTVIEAKNRGLSDDQAVTMGVLYGLVEGLSEKYSIETILKEPTSIRQMLMKSFIAEGSEEVVANWGDRLVDAMIERGSDQLTEEYNRLRKAGYSETQASLMVFWDCVKEDASAFLAGGLSGLAMSGAHAAINKTSEGVSMGALKLAEKLAEKADYVSAAKEAMSSEGWDTVRFIDEAKEQAEEQGNKKALRLLENIDKTVYKHGVDKVSYADVANVLTLLDRGKSAEALGTSEQAPKDGKAQKKSNSAQAQGDGRAYSSVKAKDGAEIRSYHFGESHKNGIIMKDAQGNTHTIVAVESSEAYHGERENSVVLRDSEGRSYGADELSASDSSINALLGISSSYKTSGAQALLANWDSYKEHAREQGREASLEEYQNHFFGLYNAGVTGLDADTTQNSVIYRGAYSALGLRAARSATASGYNDGVRRLGSRARALQRLRIPGLKRSIESRVYIPEGTEVRLSDNTKALLDGVAKKLGRDIVLDKGLDGSVNGLFDPTDGKLHLRADINDNYAVAAALHEAVHSIADVNPEGYEALRAFVMNYHALIGNDVEAMIELKGAEYGEKAPTREARIEEIVANTVMALAADEKALNKAIGIEKNKSLLEKVAEVIKELAQRVKRFIRENTTNEEAKAILDDAEALDMLAELFAQAADEAKENLSGMNEGAIEKENAHRGARYSFAVNDVIDDEYRDLVAVHNLSEDKLQKAFKLGGFPMPSIAVTKQNMPHESYGDISLLFGKDTINPDVNRNNRVYGEDAWTPRYPEIEYEVNQKQSSAFYYHAQELAREGKIEFFNPVSLHPDNLSERLNRANGEEGLIRELRDDYGMKNLFLKDTTGESVGMKQTEKRTRLSDEQIEARSFIYEAMPEAFDELRNMNGKDWLEKYGDRFRAAREEYYKSIFPDITDEQLDNIFRNEKRFKTFGLARMISEYGLNGAESVETVEDLKGTQEEIDRRIDKAAYYNWLDKNLSGIEARSGIRNGSDPYTAKGNKRSFAQTHYTVTLENVVKAMKQQRNGDGVFFAGWGLWGVAAKSYGSFADMKEDSKRLKQLTDDEIGEIKESFGKRFEEIVDYITENGRKLSDNPYTNLDICFENVLDAVRQSKTKSGLIKYLRGFYGNVITETVADDILNLIADVGNMPARYFEAKPERAVGFNEVKAAVVPKGTSQEIKDGLKKQGVPVFEYDDGNVESRREATGKAIQTEYIDANNNRYSDLRFAVNDVIDEEYEAPLSDEEEQALWDDEARRREVDLYNVPKGESYFDSHEDGDIGDLTAENSESAVMILSASAQNTAEKALRGFKQFELNDGAIDSMVEEIARDYEIDLEENPGIKDELKSIVTDFIAQVEEGRISTQMAVSTMTKRIGQELEHAYRWEIDPEAKRIRDDIVGELRETIKNPIIVRDHVASIIAEEYGSYDKFRRMMFGKVGLKLARNMKGAVSGNELGNVIRHIKEVYGEAITNYGDVEVDSDDSAYGLIWLEHIVNSDTYDKAYVNPWLDGEFEDVDTAAMTIAYDVIGRVVEQKSEMAQRDGERGDKKTITALRKVAETSKREFIALMDAQQADYERRLKEAERKHNELLDELGFEKARQRRKAAEIEQKAEKRAEAKYLERYEKARESMEKQRSREHAETLRQRQGNRDRYRQWKQKTRARYVEKNAKYRDNYNRSRALTAVIAGIKRLANTFESTDKKATKQKYFPQEVRNAGVVDALEELTDKIIFDPDSGLDTRQARARGLHLPGLNGSVGQAVMNLKAALNKLVEGDEEIGDYGAILTGDFLDEMERLAKELQDDPNKLLSLENARKIYGYMKVINHAINHAREQIGRKESITNRVSGERVINATLELGKKKGIIRLLYTARGMMLNSRRMARMYSGYNDDSEFMYHTNELEKGWVKWQDWSMDARKAFMELTESSAENRRAYRDSLNKVINVTFTENNGQKRTVRMTRMQGLTILMTWQRELTDGLLVHMQTGGIEISDPKTVLKGMVKISDIFGDDMQRIRAVNIDFIKAVEDQMTDFEREYRKIAERYFNEVSRNAINEVMLKLWHREIANSKYYIPYLVSEDFTGTNDSQLSNINDVRVAFNSVAIEDRGSYKNTVPKSKKPIRILSLNTIIDKHINETGQLYGLGIPVRNMKRAFNTNIDDERTVRSTFSEVFGKKAKIFINNMMSDVEAQRREVAEFGSSLESALRKGFAHASLVFNGVVAMKQTASFLTAARYINIAHLTTAWGSFFRHNVGLGRLHALMEEIDSHTPLHFIRRVGLTSSEIADLQTRLGSKLNSWLPNASVILNPEKWIQGMDCLTTAVIWDAAKNQISAEYRKDKGRIGSEEYWQKVTELYERTIMDTQPMYDPLHRSEAQKSRNAIARSVTRFATQPFQNSGILFDALGEMVAKHDKKSVKGFASAVGSQLASALIFAGMSFLGAMMRHKKKRYLDEDGDLTFWSIAGGILSDFGEGLVRLLAPIGGDVIYSLITKLIGGKSFNSDDIFENTEFSAINQLINTVIDLWNYAGKLSEQAAAGSEIDGEKVARTFANAICSALDVTGVPATNIKNAVYSVIGYLRDGFKYGGNALTDNSGQFTDEYLPSKIYNALIDGDVDKAKELEAIWRKELMAGGMSEEKALEKIKGKLVGKLAEDESVISAAQSKYDGDYSAYDKARQRVIDLGFDEKDVDSAITRNINKLSSADKPAEEAEPTGRTAFDSSGAKEFTKKDAFNALVRGDEKSFELARRYLESNGVDEKELTSYMRSWSTTESLWDRYFTAYQKSDSKTMKELKAVLVRIYGSEEEFKLKVSGKNGKGGYYEKWLTVNG